MFRGKPSLSQISFSMKRGKKSRGFLYGGTILCKFSRRGTFRWELFVSLRMEHLGAMVGRADPALGPLHHCLLVDGRPHVLRGFGFDLTGNPEEFQWGSNICILGRIL